ncbi:helix-turn-helix transcriptional regulator [Thermincola potens]|uniref:Transcriptional regulator n=1 Tax=Thermincola potens (strain JR) TaxID=635013 RepID=D5XE57_THEPJ|nr:WYL domain-containing protein [Thermincola potens]ADG81928.1 transcriptional regulator [Thermincola potens JR]
MPENKLTRSVRLTKMQDFIRLKTPGGGATLQEIAQECGVTPRQVFRDLMTLERDLGVRLTRPGRGNKETGRYKIEDTFGLKIDSETAAVMFLSILRQKGSPLAIKINQIKDILIAALFKNRYAGQLEGIKKLQNRVHIVEEQLLDIKKAGEVLTRLLNALAENNVVSIRYFTPTKGAWSTRDVEPYGLCSKHNVWYLIGYCRKNRDTRTFRIDLIDYVFVRTEKFRFPEDFCLDSYFGESWGVYASDEAQDVLIKVSSEIAYRFRLLAYHPSQQIVKELEDGSIIVSYRTSGIYEFTGWLLQWAEFVEVLEPVELRRQMREKLEKMVERYV